MKIGNNNWKNSSWTHFRRFFWFPGFPQQNELEILLDKSFLNSSNSTNNKHLHDGGDVHGSIELLLLGDFIPGSFFFLYIIK